MISRGSDGPDHRIRSLPFDFRLSPLSFPAFPVSISNLPLASLSRAHTTGSAHPPLLAAPRNPNPTRPLRMSASEASPAEQPAPPAAAPAASTESSPTPSPARKEELLPVGEKISELNESQSELLARLRGLKEDLQNWKSNLDTQVTKYKVELSDIKSVLNNEIEQLRSDFQELRTTLKKQQEDVSVSLKNLGLQDATENDGSKGSGEESTNEDLSANLGSLKLGDASENHDESGDAKDDKTEESTKEGTPSDE